MQLEPRKTSFSAPGTVRALDFKPRKQLAIPAAVRISGITYQVQARQQAPEGVIKDRKQRVADRERLRLEAEAARVP